MGLAENNRFQTFFQDDIYRRLKNDLYNYRLRKNAVERAISGDPVQLVLEVGSGLSPIITKTERVIYSELSFTALAALRSTGNNGMYVVADATNLPFKGGCFSHTVCSEVLEHIEADGKVVDELTRVMAPGGFCTITFPHRKAYFSIDDCMVNHFRRYELGEIDTLFTRHGLQIKTIGKILGPFDKLAWLCGAAVYTLIQKRRKTNMGRKRQQKYAAVEMLAFLFKQMNRFVMLLAWCEARIVPRSMASVLLMKTRLPVDGHRHGGEG